MEGYLECPEAALNKTNYRVTKDKNTQNIQLSLAEILPSLKYKMWSAFLSAAITGLDSAKCFQTLIPYNNTI